MVTMVPEGMPIPTSFWHSSGKAVKVILIDLVSAITTLRIMYNIDRRERRMAVLEAKVRCRYDGGRTVPIA